MEIHMVEEFKRLLKTGRWPISPQGILISLDDSEDSFDSAAEEDDEEYLNGIFCSHSLPSHKPYLHSHGCHQAHIKQILMKEMQEHEKHAQQSAKNAAELLQQEEQERLKLERRKERKRKKKERKKAGKEGNKSSASNENGELKNSIVHNNNDGIKISDKGKRDKNSTPEDERTDDEDNEGFLDINSAFVTKVVKHKLRSSVNNVQSKSNSSISPSKGRIGSPAKESTNGTRLVPIPEKNIHLGERLAVAGYQCASKENYEQAIELFTRALRNVPNDHRYWGNRSFCFFQIGAYQKALEDADCAIQLAPNSPKGHYRRAEALAGLKDLVSAEKSFEKVLELDADCKDASDELLNIRMLRITEMGFDKKQAYCALKKYTTLEAAVEALMNNENFDVEPEEDENVIYQSDEELNWDDVGVFESYDNNHESYAYSQPPSEVQSVEYHHDTFLQQPLQDETIENHFDDIANKISKKQAAMDPSNPNRCVSIWVGNIEECVTEKALNDEFSRFGEILSIRMLPSSHCAFINFKDSKAPGPAMAAMQGKDLAGKKLIIRYPNKTKEEQHIHQQMLCHQKRWQSALSESESEPAGASGGSGSSLSTTSNTKTTLVPTAKGTRIKLKGPVNGAECYFWRTTGCAFGDNCRNKHIKENRGVDRKPWHK